MLPLATIGMTALWLVMSWLASAIVCAHLSERKGYGERPGLTCGLLLNVIGVLVWLVIPSRRRRDGPRAPGPPPSDAPGTG